MKSKIRKYFIIYCYIFYWDWNKNNFVEWFFVEGIVMIFDKLCDEINILMGEKGDNFYFYE